MIKLSTLNNIGLGVAQLVAGWQPSCEKMEREWENEEEMEREWGNEDRFTLYIFSLFLLPLYPFPISKIVWFCRKMLVRRFSRECHKRLNIRTVRKKIVSKFAARKQSKLWWSDCSIVLNRGVAGTIWKYVEFRIIYSWELQQKFKNSCLISKSFKTKSKSECVDAKVSKICYSGYCVKMFMLIFPSQSFAKGETVLREVLFKCYHIWKQDKIEKYLSVYTFISTL